MNRENTKQTKKPLLAVRFARPDEVESIHSIAREKIGGMVADLTKVRSIQRNDPRTLIGVYRGQKIVGFYALLMLNDAAIAAMKNGSFSPSSPRSSHLVAPETKPTGIYVWAVVAEGLLSKTLPMTLDLFSADYQGIDLYCKPLTQGGKTAASKCGFTQLKADKSSGATGFYLLRRSRLTNKLSAKFQLANNIETRVASSLEDLMRAMSVRSAVFLAEQNCPYNEEFDGNDFAGSTHLVGYVDGEPAATLRLRFFCDFAHLGRMAVIRRFRGRQVARRLVEHAKEICREKGYRTIYGQAQAGLEGFWEEFDFRPMARGNEQLYWSGHSYIEMTCSLAPHKTSLNLRDTDPMTLLRPEGRWDCAGILEHSVTSRPTAKTGAGL